MYMMRKFILRIPKQLVKTQQEMKTTQKKNPNPVRSFQLNQALFSGIVSNIEFLFDWTPSSSS